MPSLADEGDVLLTMNSYGDIRTGMTIEEAARRLHVAAPRRAPWGATTPRSVAHRSCSMA